MRTKLFLATSLPLWALATWSCFRSPEVETVVQEKIVYPEKVEACVSLTKFQLEKMLGHFNEDDHPSEMKRFKSLVKREGDRWRISSTHLAKGAEKYSLPDGKFFVVYTGSEEGDGTWELMSNNELHGKWHPKDSDNYGIEVWSR